MGTAEICRRAAELIEEKGWWQGALYGPGGEVCVLGALLMAAEVPSLIDAPPSFRDLVDGLEEEIDTGEALDLWNDEEGRTKKQVIVLLRGEA